MHSASKVFQLTFRNNKIWNFILPRSIYLNSVNMEKVMEVLDKNPYYGKYANKIKTLKKESPEEFLNRAENAFKFSESEAQVKSFSKVAEKKKADLPSAAYAFAPQKKLDSIMKIDLLKDRTAEEIKYIWTRYFSTKDAISGIMPAQLFDKIQDRSVQYPMFIFPLPRDQGYEFIYVQFAANEIHFTPLINYQAHQENAPECLTMVHYPDLKSEKGVVLMHGEFNKDILTAKEAQFLANEVTLYYGGNDQEKIELLRKFHSSPSSFNHLELVEQIEKLDLGALAGTKA
ncbi:UNVERIFIED_CONTAM: hypothetical protein GTU68_039521 [Idotea baltica]|nr:hypothetical protein [Idotea baltica]